MDSFDFVILGAGSGGIVAAITAGRAGKTVALIDRRPALGGTPVHSGVTPLMTFHCKRSEEGRPKNNVVASKIPMELIEHAIELGGSPGHTPDPIGFVETVTWVEPPILAEAMEALLAFSGATFIGGRSFAGAHVQGGRVHHIKLLNQRGKVEKIAGDYIIDASGDALIFAAAGEQTVIGRPGDGLTQPMTQIFTVKDIDLGQVVETQVSQPDDFVLGQDAKGLRENPVVGVSGYFSKVARAHEEGWWSVPRDRILFFGEKSSGRAVINTTRVTGFDPLDSAELKAAKTEGEKQVEIVFKLLKERVPGFEDAEIEGLAPAIGVRETRRIVGVKTLTEEMVLERQKDPDIVGKGAFPIDIHNPDDAGLTSAGVEQTGWYGIPFDCCRAVKCSNLYAAGRIISCDHRAFASVRVTPTVMSAAEGLVRRILAGRPVRL